MKQKIFDTPLKRIKLLLKFERMVRMHERRDLYSIDKRDKIGLDYMEQKNQIKEIMRKPMEGDHDL